MTGRLAAFARLFALQANWTYERMHGVGVAHASAPLLAALPDPERRRAALGRASEPFNAHPVLAAAAVGAAVAAECDGVPPDTVRRLKQAIGASLGGLGDRLFWAGLVPALVGAALVGVAAGAGPWAAAGLVVAYGAVRTAVQWWALGAGLTHGVRVGGRLQAAGLGVAASRAGAAAGLLVGAGAVAVALQDARALGVRAPWLVVGLALVLLALVRLDGVRFPPRLTVLVIGLVVWAVREVGA